VRPNIALRNLVRTTALILSLCATSPRAAAQVLYAIDGGGMATFSNLYTINPSNGAVLSTVGTVMLAGSPVPLSGISFDPTDGVLFGTTNSGPTTRLVTINPMTSQATSAGTIGLSMQGLAFAPNGVLFGYSKAGITGNASFPKESLYIINPATGAATLVGPSGFANTQGDGLGINSAGTIFFSATQSTGQLSLLSPSTGTASTFANLTGGPATTAPIKGLAFDNSGDLFGIYNGTTTDLLQISTTPAGGNVTITDLGVITPATTSVLTALAFQPAAVPEPSAMALVSAAGMTLGWLAQRRRSRTR
jgi:hypothetical protein